MDITKIPNKVLANKTTPIPAKGLKNGSFSELISDMRVAMIEHQGVGLAANQMGKDLSIFVIDANLAKESNVPDAYINPEITEYAKDTDEMEEGCLSIPEYYVGIRRSKKIKIKALDENGNKIKLKARGFLARVLQHETDHLNGLTIKNRAEKNQMTKNSTKIVFFGTSDFAVPALKSLINFGYSVIAVVTQPEKPAGRLRITMPSPVKKTALENNIPVLEPHNLKNDDDFFKNFHKLAPNICIVAAYGKIIPIRYLGIPEYGFINIHPSLLPKYRGPSPIQTAILNGTDETGVTIMKMDEQVDHGPILGTKSYYLLPTTYYPQAEKDLAEDGAELLIEILPKYINEEMKPMEQDYSQATFTNLISHIDGHINWNKPAEEIYNQIRALNPEPGTWTTWQDKTLNIKNAKVLTKDCSDPEGTIVKIDNLIAVTTKKHHLILEQIQLEGRKEMDAKSFLNGHSDFLNSRLE